MKLIDCKNIFTITGAASVNSAALPSSFIDKITVQATVTGSTQGTVKIQVSNDTAAIVQANGGVPANWTDLPSSTLTLSSAITFLLAVTELCHGFIRFVYTQTNATAGSVIVNIKTKGPY